MPRLGLTFALIGLMLTLQLSSARAQNDISEADGFVFDGPADRPANDGRTTQRPGWPTPSRPFTTGAPGGQTTTTTQSSSMLLCIQNCPATPEYNPVCGTDNVVYSNPGKLNCAINCGQNTGFRHYGPCNSAIRGSG